MDANSLIGNKQQKHHEGEGKNEISMKVNDLPDELLQEILSILPVREAVQTSVLSKRWKNQWMDISKIELVEAHGRRQQFKDFVDKLFALHNISSLRKFSLACDVRTDIHRINRWLSGFITPHIQELVLHFDRFSDDEELLDLPDHLFISKSLTHFHLSMPRVFRLPSLMYFPNLKILTLGHVIFPDTSLTQQFFFSFPSLEQLTLIDCNWKNVRLVSIFCPLLQKLTIREWGDDDEYVDDPESDEENDAAGQNVRTYCRIMIMGYESLRKFSYDGDILNDYYLYGTSSVTDGVVEVHPPPDNTLDAGQFVLKLLKEISDVEKLSISDYAAEALCTASFLIARLPVFNNLVELSVASMVTMDLKCPALLTILRHSPVLEALQFTKGVFVHKNAVNMIGPLPTCFVSHLKLIKIYGFTGNEEEMLAIQFLLESTPVLDYLCVYIRESDFDSRAGSKKLARLRKRITEFPRASLECGFEF